MQGGGRAAGGMSRAVQGGRGPSGHGLRTAIQLLRGVYGVDS